MVRIPKVDEAKTELVSKAPVIHVKLTIGSKSALFWFDDLSNLWASADGKDEDELIEYFDSSLDDFFLFYTPLLNACAGIPFDWSDFLTVKKTISCETENGEGLTDVLHESYLISKGSARGVSFEAFKADKLWTPIYEERLTAALLGVPLLCLYEVATPILNESAGWAS